MHLTIHMHRSVKMEQKLEGFLKQEKMYVLEGRARIDYSFRHTYKVIKAGKMQSYQP